MARNYRIVVADPVDGPPAAVYVGEDAVAADAAYDKAALDEANAEVVYFIYPAVKRSCTPRENAERVRDAADTDKKERQAREEARKKAVAEAEERFKRAHDELHALAGTSPVTELQKLAQAGQAAQEELARLKESAVSAESPQAPEVEQESPEPLSPSVSEEQPPGEEVGGVEAPGEPEPVAAEAEPPRRRKRS